MAPRHMLIALALLACGAEPGAQSSSPPAGQDTILIAGHALYVQSGFNVNLFAEGLGGVRSLALGPGGAVFAALTGAGTIVRLVDANGDGVADAPSQTVLSGLNGSVGLAFHPTTGELWANNNDRDDIGGTTDRAMTDSLPPEHVNILKDGKWYGWPQCYLPGKPNPEYPGFDCSGVEPPAITDTAHSAPLGLAFYTGTMFPAAYQGDAFMTYHGSWNRSVPTGAEAVRVRVQSGRPTAIEDFVTGWQLAGGSRWGRPVGLLVMPDGALLVSDDAGGRIWRVTYGR